MVQFTNKLSATALDGLYMLRSLFQFHEMFVSLSIEGSADTHFTNLKNGQNSKILAKFEVIFIWGGSVYTVKV